MRHRKAGSKFNRTASHRKAMFRNMVTSLIEHERVVTTDAKARALKAWGDKLITLAKRGDLHARRQAAAILMDNALLGKLFGEIAERFQTIEGGYTSSVKLGFRPGDAAPLTMVELSHADDKAKGKGKKKKAKAPSAEKKAKAASAEKKAKAKKAEPATVAETAEAQA